ncbi:MAG: DNA integrity scanning protein DisA nucleotide-binding domain protein [Bacillota bacterium]
MKDINKLKKYMRFLRLYLNGIVSFLDKELSPKIQIVILKKNNNKIQYSLLPNYHPMNVKKDFNYNISLNELINKNIYKKIIKQVFKKHNKNLNRIIIYSKPIILNKKIITIRITLKQAIYKQYNFLQGYKYLSFIEAAFDQVIRDINNNIELLKTNKDFVKIDFKETIRRGAIRFINTSLNRSVLTNIFNQINNISSLYYESNVSKGEIIVIDEKYLENKHSNIEKIMLLKSKVTLKNKRLIRKLLEISHKNISLLSDGKFIYGIGRLSNKEYQDDLFRFKFKGIYEWEFFYNDKKLLEVDYEKIKLPTNKVTYSVFKKRINELFDDMSIKNITKLYSVLLGATKQKHGTMLVISPNARSETIRLKSQCFRVRPKKLNAEIIKEITAIDGAVLIDTKCYCHGIGVILDGMASSKGDTSRGARYNSAIRYVETVNRNEGYSDCLAVVISEDGYVDLISKYTINYLN